MVHEVLHQESLVSAMRSYDIFLSGMHFHRGDTHEISRNNVYEDVKPSLGGNPFSGESPNE